MPEYTPWNDREINTTKARNFRQIVTAGWANLSDGDVEAPTGAFSLVHIEPAEVAELIAAVFEDSYGTATEYGTYPGSYIVEEDSDGNTTLIEYLTLDRALEVFNRAQREFALWGPACPNCGNEGPHDRLAGNLHKCACGEVWDPTDGVESKREDMALEVKTDKTRHMFDFVTNNASSALCKADGGLVRQVWANVNCERCLAIHNALKNVEDANDAIEEIIDTLLSKPEVIDPGWRPKAISTYEDPTGKLYLVCSNCGEAFDSITVAYQHGTADLSGSAGWCGDEGFNIVPESDAF